MNWFDLALDVVLRLDHHVAQITTEYGVWTYVILFLVVFAETGLVVTPFLPGDSLLFAAGAVCAIGALNAPLLIVLLIIAAVLGDGVNYAIGARFGDKVFTSDTSRLFNRRHLERTHQFYEKYGGKTIVLARFVPIVRTFAPFVAGIGKMSYSRFALYNVVGAVAWVVIFVVLGLLFASQEIVKKNFSIVVFGIIAVSIMPMIIEVFRSRKQRHDKKSN